MVRPRVRLESDSTCLSVHVAHVDQRGDQKISDYSEFNTTSLLHPLLIRYIMKIHMCDII